MESSRKDDDTSVPRKSSVPFVPVVCKKEAGFRFSQMILTLYLYKISQKPDTTQLIQLNSNMMKSCKSKSHS